MKKTLLTLAVGTALLGTSVQAFAAGFQLAETSATGLGRAFAGEAAMADNASAQARNPAMMTYLKGTQVSTGGIYVMPNIDVNGDMTLSAMGHQLAKFNADASDVGNNAFVPNFYVTHQIDENWTVGLGLNSNYGLATETPTGHAASIFGNHTSITSVEFNPNVAYRINDAVSIGAGLRVVHAKGEIGATMPNWIDQVKPALGGMIGQLPKDKQAQAMAAAGMIPAGGASLKSLEGDDTGFGWQVGGAWQINAANRIGFAYHSKVDLDLEGQASGALYQDGQHASFAGYIPLELPAFAEVSSFHQITDKFAMHTSINWTDWSSFDEIRVFFPDSVKPIDLAAKKPMTSDQIKVEKFEDNWRFAVGSTYKIAPKWTLRGGVALDKSAATDEHRTSTIPDSDRLWFSAGAGYQATDALHFDLGVTYIKAIGHSPINETQDVAGLAQVNFSGETTGDVWLTGVQASYKF